MNFCFAILSDFTLLLSFAHSDYLPMHNYGVSTSIPDPNVFVLESFNNKSRCTSMKALFG